MDKLTIEAYDSTSEKVFELHQMLLPLEIYELIKNYFFKDDYTIDIGCGIGRDTFWLKEQGFHVVGLDASKGMLSIARRNYPTVQFREDFLPDLITIKSQSFKNVLCSAVLMHLPEYFLEQGIKNLIRITKKDGIIIVSFRNTNATDYREDNKLYNPITPIQVVTLFKKQGATNLHFSEKIEEQRNLKWYNLVFKK